jgi:hypothetical protein
MPPERSGRLDIGVESSKVTDGYKFSAGLLLKWLFLGLLRVEVRMTRASHAHEVAVELWSRGEGPSLHASAPKYLLAQLRKAVLRMLGSCFRGVASDHHEMIVWDS